MYIPTATYRIQLQKTFNLKDLSDMLDYLDALGISTVYASPVTTARSGSSHGYDVTDPLQFNPEIGTVEEWDQIVHVLKAKNMGWLQDIVPNHMAYTIENPWIFDVLERGADSEFYKFFDIIPQVANPFHAEKIMVPVLGQSLEDCIKQRQLQLVFQDEGFFLKMGDLLYPVATESYSWIASAVPDIQHALLAWAQKVHSFAQLAHINWLGFKSKMLDEVRSNDRLKKRIESSVDQINSSESLMAQLISFQHYQLVDWRTSMVKMNYRRFFAVNALICLRMEDRQVFDTWHSFMLEKCKQGLIQGFRVDHIDGLYNPPGYLTKLRSEIGSGTYLITEKIFKENEETIPSWPVQGTTGYDFLAFANQLMTFAPGKEKLVRFYLDEISGSEVRESEFEKKHAFLRSHMQGEVTNLMRWLMPWLEMRNIKVEIPEMRTALEMFMSCFPVYRVYPEKLPLRSGDQQYVDEAFADARQKDPERKEQFDILASIFLVKPDDPSAESALRFIQRWAQFTGPLAAKGIEDTLFYTYNALIGNNEVGDSPAHTAVDAARFHEMMINRQKKEPHTLNATSTHDTKRGEENRLRINLIALYADEWIGLMRNMMSADRSGNGKTNADVPLVNHVYMIYQALLGALPEDLEITPVFIERFKAYLEKALREGKVNTNWEDPNPDYENLCYAFTDRVLGSEAFHKSFLPFARKMIGEASLYSLGQTLLKLTAPGIPDIYQGAELWDLSLVDPDNRLPVDFAFRKKCMDDLIEKEKQGVTDTLAFAKENKTRGLQKLLMIRKLLHFRRDHAQLFSEGQYIPLIQEQHCLAFKRVRGNEELLILVELPSSGGGRTLKAEGLSGTWQNLITEEKIAFSGEVDLDRLLKEFPVAALHLQNE